MRCTREIGVTLKLATNPKLSILAREAMRHIICFLLLRGRLSVGRQTPTLKSLVRFQGAKPPRLGHVAQWIEQWFPGPQVWGSNPHVAAILGILRILKALDAGYNSTETLLS